MTLALTTNDQTTAQLAESVAESIGAARAAAQRRQSMNNLKMLTLALHNYHSRNKCFPPAAVRNDQGKKLLSWRVLVLPFLEQEALFRQFHLDEPWDSPHNRKLADPMPEVFQRPGGGVQQRGSTCYVAPVGEKMAFTGGEGIPMKQFTDGTSNTICLVEVDPRSAVVWTKPDDLQVDLGRPAQGLIGARGNGFLTAYADGSVHFLGNDVVAKTLKALLTRNGGEPGE